MDISTLPVPRRLYDIPAKIRYHPLTFKKFKEWVSNQEGVVVNQEEPFCFQRPNGRHCRSFKNSRCTRDFLRVCRNFLMTEMAYYPVSIRPLTLGQFIDKQKQEVVK